MNHESPSIATGESCAHCHEPEFWVPDYLFTTPSGGKAFTAARQIVHASDCPTLVEGTEV